MRYVALALALAALVAPAATLTAQKSDDEWLDHCQRDRWDDRSARARHCGIRETGMKATGRPLTVAPGMNGGVEIVGWDRDSIAVTARIQVTARSDEAAEAIARDIRIEASGNSVRATGGRDPLGGYQYWSAYFIVMVPRRTDLTISTHNGPLSVEDVAGQMDLSTQNGPLYLSGVGGDVHARAQNGPLTIELLGSRWDGAGLDAETQNGPADLRIPENYNARIEFGTVNGPMDLGFPLTVTLRGRIRDRINTTLGTGGPPIRVVTTNGPMSVRRSR